MTASVRSQRHSRRPGDDWNPVTKLRAVRARSTLRGAGRVNPPDAISTLKRGRPDLIVLDPQMIGLDGLRLLKQIRTLDATIPVVVVTGKQAAQEAPVVLKTGVFAYVPKPCDFASLDHLIALAPTDASNR
jgi:DNA-binding NtrC family response regulator